MPHSTQIRVRCVGSGVFDEKRRFRNDIRVSRDSNGMLSYGTRGDGVTLTPANPRTGRRHSLDSRIRQKVGTRRGRRRTLRAPRELGCSSCHSGVSAGVDGVHDVGAAGGRLGGAVYLAEMMTAPSAAAPPSHDDGRAAQERHRASNDNEGATAGETAPQTASRPRRVRGARDTTGLGIA
jgi:hypothetical protein